MPIYQHFTGTEMLFLKFFVNLKGKNDIVFQFNLIYIFWLREKLKIFKK